MGVGIYTCDTTGDPCRRCSDLCLATVGASFVPFAAISHAAIYLVLSALSCQDCRLYREKKIDVTASKSRLLDWCNR